MHFLGVTHEQLGMIFEFIILFLLLVFIQYAYLIFASRLGILDVANRRSSHTGSVVRGGLVTFPVSLVISYFSVGQHFLFTIGLLLIAAVSFIDDLQSVRPMYRLIVQLFAGACILLSYEFPGVVPFDFDPRWLWGVPAGMVFVLAVFNAFNFMDGINGLTVGYTLLTLFTLLLFNLENHWLSYRLLVYSMLPLLIFLPLNFRRRAICFPGDVGAISIGYVMAYIFYPKVFVEYDPYWLVLVGIYGVDVGLSFFNRLRRGENVFYPGRQHLFQLLVDRAGMTHLQVASIYIGLQAFINLGFWLLYEYRAVYSPLVILLLSVVYVLLRLRYDPRRGVSPGSASEA